MVNSSLFPTAIIAACCDMATVISNHPFTSFSQFIEFVRSRLNDETKTTEESHLIIYQRHCLAYPNKDQLLFQVGVGGGGNTSFPRSSFPRPSIPRKRHYSDHSIGIYSHPYYKQLPRPVHRDEVTVLSVTCMGKV